MKPLRKCWQEAEGWDVRYNALLVAGLANASPRDLRDELDSLLADIARHHHDQAAARALRTLQGGAPRPAAIAQDMGRLYDWMNTR